MLRTRILTALVGLPCLLFIIYTGGWLTHTFFILLAIVGVLEYFAMMKKQDFRPLYSLGLTVILVWTAWFYRPSDLPFVFLTMIMGLAVFSVLRFPDYILEDIAMNMTGIFYIGFLINFAILFNYHGHSFLLLLLSLLIAWANDTGGYLFGSIWGKRKMAPKLSPNKTWEGALGGILTAAAVVITFFYLQDAWRVDFVFMAAVIVLGSLAGQIGDLLVSSMKRFFGVKDTGNIIPGHGGVLDRFDSFLLILPVLYTLLLWFEVW